MSYGDYGGHAYRDGKHIRDRSDATIPLGGHVVLGDGPIFLVFHKTSILLFSGTSQEASYDAYDTVGLGTGTGIHNLGAFSFEGHTIDIVFSHEHRVYAYAKLTQPDGTLWHGWSGMGVGVGFEGGDLNSNRDAMMHYLWPESRVI